MEDEEKKNEAIAIVDENKTIQLQPLTRDIIRQHNDLIEYVVREEMIENIHYGFIPNTKGGKVLLKPGGDLLKRTFNLIDLYDIEVIDEGDMHRTYEIKCTLNSLINEKTHAVGYGVCSSLESKYRYEWVYVNNQKDHQEEIPIEKRPDKWNTIKKMSKKRAMLDAVNSFFSPAGFFPGKDTDKKYENRIEFDWKPKREDLTDPGWYVEQIDKAHTRAEITKFLEEFKMDIKFFAGNDLQEINDAVAKRWKVIK